MVVDDKPAVIIDSSSGLSTGLEQFYDKEELPGTFAPSNAVSVAMILRMKVKS